jgi:perosamine synthetase
MFKIPVYKPSLTGNEKKYVNECIDTEWISAKGRFVPLFEEKFSEFIGVKYASTVSNGTIALHLALIALGIGPGDEVIVPTFTYIAPVNSIVYVGAKPVFVDSLANNWQIDPEDVKRKITDRTKAIIAVHLYGHPCDLNSLRKIADEKRIFLVEDCAEAFGSLYDNVHVGTVGDISTFSFYGNKTITTGEGGMVVTNDKTLYDRAKHYKGQGLAKYREYWHDVIGYNFRMTNIASAIGLAQLEQADEKINAKLEIARIYNELIEGSSFEIQKSDYNVRNTYWMYSVLVPKDKNRDDIRSTLEKNGIETRPTFYPVHTMPMYSAKYERHIVAEDVGWRGINLPSYPGLTSDDIAFIINTLKSAI